MSSKAYQDKCWQGHKSHHLKSAVLELAQSSYDSLCFKVLNKMSNHCHGHCHQLCHHPGSGVFPGLSLHPEHGVIPANTSWRGLEKGEVKNYFKIYKRDSIVLVKYLLHRAWDGAVSWVLHCTSACACTQPECSSKHSFVHALLCSSGWIFKMWFSSPGIKPILPFLLNWAHS